MGLLILCNMLCIISIQIIDETRVFILNIFERKVFNIFSCLFCFAIDNRILFKVTLVF